MVRSESSRIFYTNSSGRLTHVGSPGKVEDVLQVLIVQHLLQGSSEGGVIRVGDGGPGRKAEHDLKLQTDRRKGIIYENNNLNATRNMSVSYHCPGVHVSRGTLPPSRRSRRGIRLVEGQDDQGLKSVLEEVLVPHQESV